MTSLYDKNQTPLPGFIYGTAWKEDDTERLTFTALKEGFMGVDTANQRRHYVEAMVGSAVARILKEEIRRREELFIQTKFTYADGQDHRIPYDKLADYPDQVRQSFKSSLEHLQVERIDSYILHGPYSNIGITDIDWKVWREMEAIYREEKTRYLGVSNVNFDHLKDLFKGAKVKPTFVQNRCFAQLGWDIKVRSFCKQNNIIYQGFSLLTANSFVLSDSEVLRIAQRVDKTPAQVIFRFAIQVGMIPLTGTTNLTHMKQDLECMNFSLSDDEVHYIEKIAL
ncbi:MAG: aldo/keto reductase [Thermoplasmata archaeon]|nr:MAG: aldo/keto reductase [Thermoplasmata archaeon]